MKTQLRQNNSTWHKECLVLKDSSDVQKQEKTVQENKQTNTTVKNNRRKQYTSDIIADIILNQTSKTNSTTWQRNNTQFQTKSFIRSKTNLTEKWTKTRENSTQQNLTQQKTTIFQKEETTTTFNRGKQQQRNNHLTKIGEKEDIKTGNPTKARENSTIK